MTFEKLLAKYAGHACIMSKKGKPLTNVYVFDWHQEAKADRDAFKANHLDGSDADRDDSLVPFAIMLGSEDELLELMQANGRKRMTLSDAMGSQISGVLLYSEDSERVLKLDEGSVDKYVNELDSLTFEPNDSLEEVDRDKDDEDDDDDDDDDDESEDE
jgi:hypothetical protein